MLTINYKVKSKYFEAMLTLIIIDFLFDWAKSHIGDFFYPIPNIIDCLLRHKIFKTPEGQLIGILELPIIWGILLDCVVSKMDKVVVNIISWKGLGRCP